MRTTVSLDEDVAAALERIRKGRGMKFKELINMVLREGLVKISERTKKRQRFRTDSVDLGPCSAGNVDNVAEVLAVAENEAYK